MKTVTKFNEGLSGFSLLLSLPYLPCIAHKAWLRLPGRLLGGVWIWSGSARGRDSPSRPRSP